MASTVDGNPGHQRILLSIAGFDPSSGAGVTADLKVFAAHGLYGVAAATALTVQSTAGVRRVEPVSAQLLAETLDCLADDLPLAGVKIGMLATAANVEAVAAFLQRLHGLPIVLDPVLRSTSGHPLLDAEAVERLRLRLLPLVSCITPNLDELLLLAGVEQHEVSIAEASRLIAAPFPNLGVVVTGGHLDQPHDTVFCPGERPVTIPGEWVMTTATHGTGCGHSSALLCGLVQGLSLVDSARAAKHYVTEALRAATPMGHGGGSMHHLYASIRASVPSQEE